MIDFVGANHLARSKFNNSKNLLEITKTNASKIGRRFGFLIEEFV